LNDGGTSLPHDGQRFMSLDDAGGAKPGLKPGSPGGGPIGIAGGIPPDGGAPIAPPRGAPIGPGGGPLIGPGGGPIGPAGGLPIGPAGGPLIGPGGGPIGPAGGLPCGPAGGEPIPAAAIGPAGGEPIPIGAAGPVGELAAAAIPRSLSSSGSFAPDPANIVFAGAGFASGCAVGGRDIGGADGELGRAGPGGNTAAAIFGGVIVRARTGIGPGSGVNSWSTSVIDS
jgi:hypothetical protein